MDSRASQGARRIKLNMHVCIIILSASHLIPVKYIGMQHLHMEKSNSYMEHQYDMWHLDKSVTKQLIKHAMGKRCEKLFTLDPIPFQIIFGGTHK